MIFAGHRPAQGLVQRQEKRTLLESASNHAHLAAQRPHPRIEHLQPVAGQDQAIG